ncbi:MAG: hypothetical protein JXA30_11885 [Deltaproteobacteria bacterium]|nr:hypothetical protein [Deltaproteobacteria bacterium]
MSTSSAWLAVVLVCYPAGAFAGGIEFPGDGTRGLGRGGAIMTRPDDPYVMARNPALLSDLWGSQLYINTIIGMPHNCSQLSGGWGWGYETNAESVLSTGKGEPALYSEAEEGSMGGPSRGEMVDLSPSAVPYWGEPYPELCYSAGATLIPSVLLSTKINEDIGVGLGFMPPELYQNNGFGGRNGVVDTPYGKRPSPLRYIEPAYQDVTYFGLLGAIGYRVLPWLRLGAGFRWTMVLVDAQNFTNIGSDADPIRDVLTDFFGKDLFIPGFTASIHIVPTDSVDIAVGYRWEDHVRLNDAKIDVTSAPLSFYSTEDDFLLYQDPEGNIRPVGSSALVERENNPGSITAEPVTVPQLSAGIRFADRIRPRPESYVGLEKNKDPVRDPMADEYWDIEFNAIYYFTSAFETQSLITPGLQIIDWESIRVTGTEGNYQTQIVPGNFDGGKCLEENANGCIKAQQIPRDYKGKDQISLRLGGDYNAIPNVLALRLGVSYESRGQDPGYVRPSWSMPFERLGLHGGLTWRIDGRTDVSIGYGHFFQETIKVALNTSEQGSGFPRLFSLDPATGETLSKEQVDQKYHVVPESEADGIAQIPIYSGQYEKQTGRWGKYYANAGTHKSGLDVVSISIMRHF